MGRKSGRVVGVEPVPLEELGRPRIDVTLRISGFFRDAFPHLVHLVDEAVELVRNLDEPAELNHVRANGDDYRIFGAKPGAYGSGILALLDSKEWESDDDLATVYLAWSGYAYGRAAYGVPAPEAMQRRFALIDVAVKNQDNREHDIFDSDDYLQEHGGMVATVRALRGGQAPQAFFGDSADPERPRVRSLAEEARRVMRSRVLNPRWISAMMRHGYKGAFEMAATVDYLYGYDATARIGEDWMYEQVTQAYVADPEVRKFFAASNPWALQGITERLLEANARGLWNASDTAPGHAPGRRARSRRLDRGAAVVTPAFPLSAVVGQDDLKLALLLHAVDPKLGGVLIRGEKGSGKSTAARALATLMGEAAPFVELPIGATEDRVVGTLDLEGALLEGRSRLRPGLLAAAHGGVLYVDEVNLLADHLVDVLIDAAAFGVNRIERDGLTAEHPSRFVLVGSMNPEEGELRPQLLDRFGLAVEVRAPRDPDLRTEVVRRRLAFDADPDGFAERFAPDEEALRAAIGAAGVIVGDIVVSDEVLSLTSRLCAELDAEGLRADLVIARGVAALAALDGRKEATADDVVRLAPLALAHRRRRGPLDAPGLSPEELADALERAEDNSPGNPATHPTGDGSDEDVPTPGGGSQQPARPPAHGVSLALKTQQPSGVLGRRNRGLTDRGGIVAARPAPQGVTDIALAATVQAAAARRATAAAPAAALVERADLRQAVREARTANLVVLCVDASGSMGAMRRMEATKGAAVSLLLDAYQRRDRVALVTFAGEEARVVLRPTGSVEVARARLADLPTGGRTPLGPGLRTALDVARSARHRDPDRRPVIVVVTDGRATSAGPSAVNRSADDPVETALAAAADIAAAGIEVLVVDAEDSDIRLGLARQLADTMGAHYTALPDLAADSLARAVEAVVATEPQS